MTIGQKGGIVNVKVNLLVLDDQRGNAQQSITSCLKSLLEGKGDLPYEPPWHIPMLCGNTLEVSCAFCSTREGARKLLHDPDRTKEYHIVLLDNDWGGDKTFGVDLLKTLSDNAVPHPLLVLYTQHDAMHELPLAIKYGAQAVVKKNDKEHFLSLLMSAAVKGLSVHPAGKIDTNEVVGHYIKSDIKNIADSVVRGRDAIRSLPGEQIAMAAALLDGALQDIDRVADMTTYWHVVAKVAAWTKEKGASGVQAIDRQAFIKQALAADGVPASMFDFKSCDKQTFLAVLQDEMNRCWTQCQRYLSVNAVRPHDAAPAVYPLLTTKTPTLRSEITDDNLKDIQYNPKYVHAVMHELLRNVLKYGEGNVDIVVSGELPRASNTADYFVSFAIANDINDNSGLKDKDAGIVESTGRIGLTGLIYAAEAHGFAPPFFEVNVQSSKRFSARVVIARTSRLEAGT